MTCYTGSEKLEELKTSLRPHWQENGTRSVVFSLTASRVHSDVGVKGDKKKEEDQSGDEGSRCWAFVVRQHVERGHTRGEGETRRGNMTNKSDDCDHTDRIYRL